MAYSSFLLNYHFKIRKEYFIKLNVRIVAYSSFLLNYHAIAVEKSMASRNEEEPMLNSQRGFLKLFRIEKTLKRRLKFQTKYHDVLNFTFNKFV